MERYLYRAPNQEEIESGVRLIPAKPEHGRLFKDGAPMFVMAHHSGTYTHVGGIADVIRRHQIHGDTGGISTTKSMEVAKRYALERLPGYRYVVRIPISRLEEHHIYDAALCGLVLPKPEDEEVVLVSSRTESFPREIIDKIWRVTDEGNLEDVAPDGLQPVTRL